MPTTTTPPRSVAPIAAAASLLVASTALAQTAQQGHSAMPGAPGGAAMTQHRPEMRQAMEKMNRDMVGAPTTGNPDRDFAAMMIPHHQGALDMARAYLQEGKNPEMRRMAERTIQDQEKKIRELREWMAKHPSR